MSRKTLWIQTAICTVAVLAVTALRPEAVPLARFKRLGLKESLSDSAVNLVHRLTTSDLSEFLTDVWYVLDGGTIACAACAGGLFVTGTPELECTSERVFPEDLPQRLRVAGVLAGRPGEP